MLTERDIEIIKWCNRFKFARATDIKERFQMGQTMVYRRLKQMVDDGFMRHEKTFEGQHGVYYPTSKGTDVVESGLGPIPAVSYATYEHDLNVLELATQLELKGWQTVSERELRRSWTVRNEKGHMIAPKHVPDLAIEDQGGVIYFEVENSTKEPGRLKRIFQWHGGQKGVKKVYYLTKTQDMADKLNDLAKQLYLDDIITALRRDEYPIPDNGQR